MMKIKNLMLAMMAVMTSAMFTACSESTTTPPPSKAEQCAAGLSTDCLMGTWSINGPTLAKSVTSEFGTDITYVLDPSHDLSASPATLKFYVDPEKKTNSFEFTNSSLSKADCKTATGKTYGIWDIVGTSLHLYARIGNDCMATSDATIPVTIATEGGIVKLTFQSIFFMEPEMKESDAVEKKTATEVYTFVTAN